MRMNVALLPFCFTRDTMTEMATRSSLSLLVFWIMPQLLPPCAAGNSVHCTAHLPWVATVSVAGPSAAGALAPLRGPKFPASPSGACWSVLSVWASACAKASGENKTRPASASSMGVSLILTALRILLRMLKRSYPSPSGLASIAATREIALKCGKNPV